VSILGKHLKHFSGVLQADAFAGYNALYDEDRQPGRIIEAGCWSHARRKLWDIHVRQRQLAGTLAHQALQRMGSCSRSRPRSRAVARRATTGEEGQHGAAARRTCTAG
jgi:hypothetical protein